MNMCKARRPKCTLQPSNCLYSPCKTSKKGHLHKQNGNHHPGHPCCNATFIAGHPSPTAIYNCQIMTAIHQSHEQVQLAITQMRKPMLYAGQTLPAWHNKCLIAPGRAPNEAKVAMHMTVQVTCECDQATSKSCEVLQSTRSALYPTQSFKTCESKASTSKALHIWFRCVPPSVNPLHGDNLLSFIWSSLITRMF